MLVHWLWIPYLATLSGVALALRRRAPGPFLKPLALSASVSAGCLLLLDSGPTWLGAVYNWVDLLVQMGLGLCFYLLLVTAAACLLFGAVAALIEVPGKPRTGERAARLPFLLGLTSLALVLGIAVPVVVRFEAMRGLSFGMGSEAFDRAAWNADGGHDRWCMVSDLIQRVAPASGLDELAETIGGWPTDPGTTDVHRLEWRVRGYLMSSAVVRLEYDTEGRYRGHRVEVDD